MTNSKKLAVIGTTDYHEVMRELATNAWTKQAGYVADVMDSPPDSLPELDKPLRNLHEAICHKCNMPIFENKRIGLLVILYGILKKDRNERAVDSAIPHDFVNGIIALLCNAVYAGSINMRRLIELVKYGQEITSERIGGFYFSELNFINLLRWRLDDIWSVYDNEIPQLSELYCHELNVIYERRLDDLDYAMQFLRTMLLDRIFNTEKQGVK